MRTIRERSRPFDCVPNGDKLIRRWSVVLFYLVVASLALNSLVMHLGTALPGTLQIQASEEIQPAEFDIFAWDLWWVPYAVFNLHVSPLYTNYVVYPFTSPLAGHTLLSLWGLASAPFQAWLGLTPTFNGIIVLCFVAAGVVMYLFARRHVRHESLALLAGLIFAFTPAMLHRASLGHLAELFVFWLPLTLLIWDQAVESRRWRWAVALGLCLYLAWQTDFQLTMWAMCLWIPYAIYGLLVHRGESKPGLRLEWLAAIALVALIVPSLIAPLPQLLEAKRLNYPLADLNHAAYFAFWPKYLFAPEENGDFSIGVLLPLLTLVSVPLIRRDSRRWLWLGIAVMCFILALGPFWKVGSTRVLLPYTLVHVLLGYQYRTPMRFATPGVLALAMAAGWGTVFAICVGLPFAASVSNHANAGLSDLSHAGSRAGRFYAAGDSSRRPNGLCHRGTRRVSAILSDRSSPAHSDRLPFALARRGH